MGDSNTTGRQDASAQKNGVQSGARSKGSAPRPGQLSTSRLDVVGKGSSGSTRTRGSTISRIAIPAPILPIARARDVWTTIIFVATIRLGRGRGAGSKNTSEEGSEKVFAPLALRSTASAREVARRGGSHSARSGGMSVALMATGGLRRGGSAKSGVRETPGLRRREG